MRKIDYHKILLTMSVIAFSMLSALAEIPLTVGGVSDAQESSANAFAVNGPIGGGIVSQPNVSSKDAAVYYPYGMRYADLMTANADRYLFSGKELDRMNGLDIYDFHARQYDPLLGRFTSPDPMEEKYPYLSPYAYCAGNPIRFIDPTGKELSFIGTIENVNATISLLNDPISEYYKVYQEKGGNIIKLTTIENTSNISESQKNMIGLLNKIINHKNNITINIIDDSFMQFGDAMSGTIDITDILNVGEGEFVNSVSVLYHELYEQYNYQAIGYSLPKSHLFGAMAEKAIMGCFPDYKNRDTINNIMTLSILDDYIKQNIIGKVIIQWNNNGGIESVERIYLKK